jgi:hypothetical protein
MDWAPFVRKTLIAKYFQIINSNFQNLHFSSINIFVIFRTKQKFFQWNFKLILRNFTLVENRVLQWFAIIFIAIFIWFWVFLNCNVVIDVTFGILFSLTISVWQTVSVKLSTINAIIATNKSFYLMQFSGNPSTIKTTQHK